MTSAELQLLISTKDLGSTGLKAFAGLLSSTVVGALADAARGAAADEANVVKLRTAVENAGYAWQDNLQPIEERIKLGQQLAFSDTQTRDSLTALTQTTGNLQHALDLQSLAMDISRQKGIDLTTASELVGLVYDGNTSKLKRYGIELKANATATEALAALQATFGGASENYAQTTEAGIFRMKDAIDEWKESIGAALGPTQQYIALLPGLSAGFSALSAVYSALIPVQVAEGEAAAASIAPYVLVIATIALVIIAFEQVIETIFLVTDNWNQFCAALKNNKLGDIPVFGAFFSFARNVLIILDAIKQKWDALFGGGSSIAGDASAIDDTATTGYASGTPYVPRTGLYKLHQGERVTTAADNAAGSGAGGGMTLVFNAPVYGLEDFRNQVREAVTATARGGGFRGLQVGG